MLQTVQGEITLGSGDNTATASVGYTISKKVPTAVPPTGLTAIYGQTLGDVELTNPEGNTPGIWTWSKPSETSVGSAGSHDFEACFVPTDNNYMSVYEN